MRVLITISLQTMQRTKLLLLAAMLLGCLRVSAAFKVGDIYYDATADLKAVVTYHDSYYYNSYSGSIIIPSSVFHSGTSQTYRVTSIGKNAFYKSSSLTSVSIPNSVTSIGEWAFSGCSSLPSITIPEGVSTIENYTFLNCSRLTSITFAGDSKLTSIGLGAFSGCSSLSSITIPEGVASLGDNTFAGCSTLATITIPQSVVRIGGYAFEGTPWYDNMSDGLVYINRVLYNYKGTMPENTSIKVKEGTVSISPYAFLDCSNLTSIIIPNSVTDIGKNAFEGCRWLSSIAIPAGVTSIGDYAFSRCYSFTSITCEAKVPPTIGGSYTFGDIDKSIPVYVPASSVSAYRSAEYWKEFTNILAIENYMPSGVCGDFLIWRLTNEGELIIDGFGDMYDYTGEEKAPWYEYRESIKSVCIGNGATSVGNYAFWWCDYITIIDIPESVKRIGSYAFYHCTGLSSVIIPDGVQEISEYVFFSCANLASVTLPNSTTSIANHAFNGCSSLASITIPDGMMKIGEYAFAGCNLLTFIYMPKSVIDIGEGAFYYCYSLISITCKAAVPPSCGGPYTFYTVDKSIPVYVPSSSVSAYRSAEYWKEFTNIIGIEEAFEDIVIDDSWEIFENSDDKICNSITYTRNFKNTNWQALYVPFEIPVTEDFLTEYEVAYINNVHQRDYDDDGDVDNTEIEAFKITKGTLRANYPYLIRAKEVGEKAIIVSNATLYATKENSIDCASVFSTYTFTGTYSRLSSDVLPQSGGYYALSGGTFRLVADGSSLGAFRYYLHIVPRNGDTATKIQAIRMRIMDEDGNEDITHVDDSEFVHSSEEVIYDLQGRKVFHPAHGVYIVNGKKVIF